MAEAPKQANGKRTNGNDKNRSAISVAVKHSRHPEPVSLATGQLDRHAASSQPPVASSSVH
jgi:hypothetical protein